MTSAEQQSRRVEILRWAAGLGAITAEALGAREERTTAAARATLAAAVRAGQLARHRPLVGRPSLYTVTRSGLRAAALPALRPTRVSAGGAQHLIVCAQVAATLEHRYADHLVVGERALRDYERRNGAPLASVGLGRAGTSRAIHRPDMALLASNGQRQRPVAVEVELTIKAPRRLAEICRAWARSRHVDGVLYLAPADVERALLRAIDAAHAEDRVAVLPLDELAWPRVGASAGSCIPSRD